MSLPLAFSFNAGQSLQNAFTNFVSYLPTLIGALVVLVIGYIVCRIVKAIVAKVLKKVGFDRRLTQNDAGKYVQRVSPQGEPSRLIGGLAFWALFLFVLSSAIGNLKIAALTTFMQDVLRYVPDVIAATLILIVGAALAGGIAGAVHKAMGDTPTGRVVRAIAPALIMSIAVFMALVQLRISLQIVEITYGALMFALALGAALAFGLGGREVAGTMLGNAYEKTDMDSIRGDIRTGRARAQEQAQQARTQAEGGGSGDAGGSGGAHRAR